MLMGYDRERRHTAAAVLERVDLATERNLERCAQGGRGAIDARLQALDREWDTDRTIELEAALTGLAGIALGLAFRPALLALPAFVAGSMFVHATLGPYPLLPALRRFGMRTQREMARERYALKALRGDFAGLAASPRAADGAEAAS